MLPGERVAGGGSLIPVYLSCLRLSVHSRHPRSVQAPSWELHMTSSVHTQSILSKPETFPAKNCPGIKLRESVPRKPRLGRGTALPAEGEVQGGSRAPRLGWMACLPT